MSAQNWLDRYREGQRDEVWHEMLQLGGAIRAPDVIDEAQLVCDAMAHRARHNIETIVERLSIDGYRFHSNDERQKPETPYVRPTAGAPGHEDWLERRFGPLPLTLRSWLRLVGDVWLVGTHPRWLTSASADPLVIEVEGSRYPDSSMRDFFEDGWSAWQESSTGEVDADPFMLDLAPDRLHKENVSGGAPYGIIVPDESVDGSFVGATTMPFVSYLNEVFRNGGFPWPTGSDGEAEVKAALAEDLLPL